MPELETFQSLIERVRLDGPRRGRVLELGLNESDDG